MSGESPKHRSLIGAIALLASGCAPSPRETGEAVLIVWPLVILIAALPQFLLIRLWQWRWPGVVIDWKRLLVLVGPAVTISVSMIIAATAPWTWAPHALWLFGTSYLAALLLVTRAWLASPWRAHSVIAPHLVTSAIFIPCAMALRAGMFETAAIDWAGFFIFPGYGGWVPGGVALLLLAERWLGRRQ